MCHLLSLMLLLLLFFSAADEGWLRSRGFRSRNMDGDSVAAEGIPTLLVLRILASWLFLPTAG